MDFKFITYVNATVIGHVIALLAVILNAFAANNLPDRINKTGVILAILALVVAYLHQSMYFAALNKGTSKPEKLARVLFIGGLVVFALTAASYLSWLFNSI